MKKSFPVWKNGTKNNQRYCRLCVVLAVVVHIWIKDFYSDGGMRMRLAKKVKLRKAMDMHRSDMWYKSYKKWNELVKKSEKIWARLQAVDKWVKSKKAACKACR